MTWDIGDLVEIQTDSFWWYIRNMDGTSTGVLVSISRHQDPFWAKKFPGGKNPDGTTSWSAYPGVRALFGKPSGGGSSLKIPKRWWDKTRSMNPAWLWEKLRTPDYGWINSAGNPWGFFELIPDPPFYTDSNGNKIYVYPRPEGISSIGNVHRVAERKKGKTRIETYKYSDPVPAVLDKYKICNFSSIDKYGNIADMGSKFPLLVQDEAWIPDEALKLYVEPEVQNNMKPLIRDYSRWQFPIDMNVAKTNGVQIMIARAAISYAYKDPNFSLFYKDAGDVGMFRSSYHVIYTKEDVTKQADNWYSAHPAIDVIPRVIDLELDHGDSNSAKADAVWEMSELVLSRDGVRPIIYSRKNLIDQWLASWSTDMLNNHYWWLAQYLSSGAEHPGPPTLPNKVNLDRVILHQTSDKLPGFPGEVGSAAVDWNRWQLGDEADLLTFIQQEWSGQILPPPPPDDRYDEGYEDALNDVDVVVGSLR